MTRRPHVGPNSRVGEPSEIDRLRRRTQARWLVVVFCVVLSVPTTAIQLYGRSAGLSDYHVHLEVVDHLQHGHLEVAHFLFHAPVAGLGFLFGTSVATLLVIALAQVGLGLLVFRLLCDAFERDPRHPERAPGLALATTAALLICAPIDVFTFPRLYFGYVSTTTYHSPTFQLLKPLALALFLRLERDVLSETAGPPRLLGMVGLSLVSTLAKPSFSVVVLPALIATVLIYRQTGAVRRTFVIVAVLGTTIGVAIVWQMVFLLAAGGDGGGIGFMPLVVASAFEPSHRMLATKLLLSIAFPLVALLCHWRAALADRRLVFSYVCLLVSLLYYLLLAERGPHMNHGNFLWGVMVSLFLVFVSTAAMLAHQSIARTATRVSWLILLLHVVCGVVWLAATNGLLGAHCNDGYANWCW